MVGPVKLEPGQDHKAVAGEHSGSSDRARVTEGRGACASTAGMSVHAPEAQCWILKLAMSVAEVGAADVNSTPVWRLMSGSARWLTVLNTPGRGTAIPGRW